MSSRAPVIEIVCDPSDSAAATKWAAAFEQAGGVVCRATPGPHSAQLARDLLRGLGKRPDLADSPRQADALWRCASTWTAAEPGRTVLVLRTHSLSETSLRRLLAAISSAGRIVLHTCSARPSRHLLHAIQAAGLGVSSIDQLDDRLPEGPQGRGARDARFPEVPHDDFTTFLARCDQTLTREQVEVIEATVRDGRRATHEWLSRTRNPGEQHCLHHLRKIASGEDDPNGALARLRGTQIELLLMNDVLVDIDPSRFLEARRQDHARSDCLNRSAARLLARYCSPLLASVGTVALICRQQPSTLATIRLHELALDASTIEVAGEHHKVPPSVRPLLHAQRIARETDAAPHDALFTRRREPQPATGAVLRGVLATLTKETGLAFHTPKQTEPTGTWAARHGLACSSLTPA